MNPSLDPACAGGGGFTPWLTSQGKVEASTCGGANASLLVQNLDGCLASADSLQMDARFRLAAILSEEGALCDLVTFDFIVSHLLSADGRHSSAVASSSVSLRYWRSSTPRYRG